MIKANELMIGNIVRHETPVGPATYIIPNGEEIDWAAKNCTAVELTEEWLIKFGFEKDEYHGCYVLFQDEDMELAYDLDPNQVTLVCGGHADSSRDMNIHYIHQLQNLFWCLTSEELIIKQHRSTI